MAGLWTHRNLHVHTGSQQQRNSPAAFLRQSPPAALRPRVLRFFERLFIGAAGKKRRSAGDNARADMQTDACLGTNRNANVKGSGDEGIGSKSLSTRKLGPVKHSESASQHHKVLSQHQNRSHRNPSGKLGPDRTAGEPDQSELRDHCYSRQRGFRQRARFR